MDVTSFRHTILARKKLVTGNSYSVDEYIANCPKDVQGKLREIRAAIREAAPDAVESISYGMPYYSFRGELGFQSRLCYFGLLKSKKKIAFYTRPVFLEEYMDEVEKYLTTKSALQFPLNRPIPVRLIRSLVRIGIRKHEAREDKR
jgi:uncharacterized protein YdhG (YjbR/CyaY superfamily)